MPSTRSPRFRTRSLTIKVNKAEYEQLTAAAGARRLGEWGRSVLLEHVSRAPIDEALMAEVWATQAVVLTVVAKLAAGDPITFQTVRQLKDSVAADKRTKARQLLEAAHGPR